MAASHDFQLSIDPATAHRITAEQLAAQGFRISPISPTSMKAERGSMGKTVMLGALAGKSMHMSFDVEVFTGPGGSSLVRLNRNLARAAMKGGVLGAARGNTAFEEVANGLHGYFAQGGILISSISN